MKTLSKIGLPKGRLAEQALALLAKAGIHTDARGRLPSADVLGRRGTI